MHKVMRGENMVTKNQQFINLLNAFLEGKELFEVVDLAAEYLDNPIVVISTSYQIIAYSRHRVSDDIIWHQATQRGYITVEFSATLHNWNDLSQNQRQDRYIDICHITSKVRRFFKIFYKNKHVGYLNVLEENPLSNQPLENYEFVSKLLGKDIFFSSNHALLQTSIQEETILLELLENKYVDRSHFFERIQESDLALIQKYCVGCIDFTHMISYNAGRDDIQDIFAYYLQNATLVVYENQLIILIKNDDVVKINKLEEFLLSKKLYLGISDIFIDLYDFQDAFLQAKNALKYQALIPYQNHIIFYDCVKEYHIYSSMSSKQLLHFCHPAIIKLNQYDELHHTDYTNTLYLFLINHKSIQETSSRLYVHRNTIIYRVEKIKEITHLSLEDGYMNHHIINSCMILRYLRLCSHI